MPPTPLLSRCARLEYSTTPTSRCQNDALPDSCFCEDHQPGKPAGVQTDLDLPTDRIFVPPLDVQVGGNHYKNMAIQPVEFCEVNNLPYCLANIVKYVVRHENKHGRQDLEKAMHYCDLGASMYEKTSRFWKRIFDLIAGDRNDEWAIIPAVFIQANGITGHAAQAILHACSVFGKDGMLGYLRAKASIAELVKENYR